MLLNIVLLTRNGKPLPAAGDSGESSLALWQPIYFAEAATLVVALAVVPCLCFFKVAADFEQRLFIDHTLLQLATDFENRALAVRKLYQDVKLDRYEAEVLGGPELQSTAGLELEETHPSPAKPVFSYHELLKVDVCPKKAPVRCLGKEPLREDPDASAADNLFFSVLSYPYNERAADDRYLAEGRSGLGTWTSTGLGGERKLILTMKRPSGQERIISSSWEPFFFPWGHWGWGIGAIAFLEQCTGSSGSA